MKVSQVIKLLYKVGELEGFIASAKLPANDQTSNINQAVRQLRQELENLQAGQ